MVTTESSYPDELAARLDHQQQTSQIKRRDYLAAFMAARTDVSAAIEAGYALKIIWEHMREIGRIPFRYETFLKYVRQHITNAPPGSTGQSTK
ncbi:peptide transporter [Ottowia sp. oral taxon 894]|uniref:TraK family protein n=1 Tax=Ottowia sp. oral taxon 894 TaxID=1658672 RepID=UPI0006836F06|nr:TraK family protein [Ottowia sp. oral taxon 894]AKU66417.1 peptide transporter [Ottowia sp. oral taxon 894]